MNKQFLRFTLYSVVVYLTLFTLNSAVVAHYLSVEDGTRSHEVTDWTSGQPDKQYLDQFPNRRYAQSFATNLNAGEPYTVRQIYFHPSDRPPSEEINATLDTLVKEVQQFYADEMERHGFGRKTFRLETDAFGKTVKHFVKGKFTSEHYDINLIDQAHEEIFEQIEWSNHLVYLIFINDDDSFSSGQVGGNSDGGHPFGGTANITLLDFDKAPDALYLRAFHTIAHELGHAFGLAHDFRDDRYILSYGSDEIIDRLSFCTAEWLNVHRYFNTSPNAFDQLPKIEMLEPSLVSPPNTIRFRFEITHSERLHQAKLLMNSFVFLNRPGVNPVVLDCKSLNANNHTVEFVTTELAHQTEDVVLHVIDVHGNFTRQVFPFDITPLLLDSKPVSIPDAILAAAIGKRLGLAHGSPITQLDMLGLKILYFSGDFPNRNPEKEITNLTGLEHATNLEYLELPFNQIGDITPLTGLKKLRSLILSNNQISDASPVAGLILLNELRLDHNPISNIKPLARLMALTSLFLADTKIKDITPLRGLMNLVILRLTGCQINDRMLTLLTEFPKLQQLMLGGNQIRDITPLKKLTNLRGLMLGGNQIRDITPLKKLTNLSALSLHKNQISDVSPLAELINLEWLSLADNPLSYSSIHTHIPTLQSRGVKVDFDDQPHPALLKISGDNQNGASLTPLSQPFVIEAQDANGSALAGVSVQFAVTAGGGTLNTTITRTDENGRAQSTLTLGPNLGTNTVSVSAAGIESVAIFYAISNAESPSITADVNSDGNVNVLDLVVIASELGNAGTNLEADVNGDGVVNILDLILVAGLFDGAAAAPSAQPQVPETLTAVEVQGWLTDARSLEVRNAIMKRGFLVLEQLLVSLTPKETELLPNYPNPFNPETWIPYRLAEDAFVTLTVYDGSGRVVRTLDVGHRIASAYESRSKAIHWDGRNDVGEGVASDVYFYTLTAGNFSATRKMLILK